MICVLRNASYSSYAYLQEIKLEEILQIEYVQCAFKSVVEGTQEMKGVSEDGDGPDRERDLRYVDN